MNSAATLRRLHLVLLIAAGTLDLAKSLLPIRCNSNAPVTGSGRASSTADGNAVAAVALLARRPRDSNWEDDTKSSRYNSEVTDYLPPWRNHEGQRAFSGSQATPGKKARPFSGLGSSPAVPPPENDVPQLAELAQLAATGQQPQLAAAPTTRRRESSPAVDGGTLLHRIEWPLTQDPPGVGAEYPLLLTRAAVTVLSTLATWYLHLYGDFSPVLASSATALLVSFCVDRRLGSAALCGSLAGTCGGHLAPTPAVAALLGALASASYEILIRINQFGRGLGGQAGAAAFVATSALACHRKVASAGRRTRRGLWSGAGPSSLLVAMATYHALGAVATVLLREGSDDAGGADDPVRAGAVVGLLGALFLKDPAALLAVQGGAFVGMSAPSRLLHGDASAVGGRRPHARTSAAALVGAFAGAGALAGLVHAGTIHRGLWNGGWGGKPGLCALAGCVTYRGLANTCGFLRKKAPAEG